MGVLDVYGGAQAAGVASDVVGEDYGPHGGLPGAGLAHQQDLLLVGHVGAVVAAGDKEEVGVFSECGRISFLVCFFLSPLVLY